MSDPLDQAGKPEQPSLRQRARDYLDAQGVSVWGGGVTGDFNGMVTALSMAASDQDTWGLIRPKMFVEQYIEDLFGGDENKEFREAILEEMNQEFRTKANAIIAEINATIGDGVKTQRQADSLIALGKKFSDLVYRRIG